MRRAREVTKVEVERLARRRGAARRVVESFLSNLTPSLEEWQQVMKLGSEVDNYGWNMATYQAIWEGIELAYTPGASVRNGNVGARISAHAQKGKGQPTRRQHFADAL